MGRSNGTADLASLRCRAIMHMLKVIEYRVKKWLNDNGFAYDERHICLESMNSHAHRFLLYDERGGLAVFDTELNDQKAGLVIRKELLDAFLEKKKTRLAWVVNGSKEIHGPHLAITDSSEWEAVLTYDGTQVLGNTYKIERRN